MNQFQFAQKAIIINENKLLMVQKDGNDPCHPNKWEIPGGRMEFGELLSEHIKREVKEEVGIEILPGKPFDMWTWIMEKAGRKYQVVAVARICKPISFELLADNQVKDDYICDMKWVPIAEVLELPLIADIRPTLEKLVNEILKEENENE